MQTVNVSISSTLLTVLFMALPVVASPLHTIIIHKLQWQRFSQNSTFVISAWLLLHALLGIACANSPVVAQIHASLVLLVGLWFAAVSKNLGRVVYIGAYLIGAEVIWRMTKSAFFYEFGKYALSLIFLVAVLRNRLFRGTPLALLYFFLLLPSAVLSTAYASNAQLRGMLSFNLSGPLALTISVWLLSQIYLKKSQLTFLLLALLAPTISVACMAAYRLATASNIFFGKSSNMLASGGFGPNQVSSVLGLGILAALLFVLFERREQFINQLMLIIAFGLGSQAALTFSRTGLYLTAFSAVIAMLCLFQERKMRMRLITITIILLVVVNFAILPRLNQFTDGALSQRFQNTDTTGRNELILTDLHIWSENPILGVGPGLGNDQRQTQSSDRASSHTEYTRLLAEHGTFGLFALFTLISICVRNMLQAHAPQQRALVLGFMSWALLFMMVSAMRLAAPAFLFGLTSLAWTTPRQRHVAYTRS